MNENIDVLFSYRHWAKIPYSRRSFKVSTQIKRYVKIVHIGESFQLFTVNFNEGLTLSSGCSHCYALVYGMLCYLVPRNNRTSSASERLIEGDVLKVFSNFLKSLRGLVYSFYPDF